MERKGIVLVFTGEGKGKTTAALGLGLRAVGHGRRVLMIQFLKGPGNLYGEITAVKYLPDFKVIQSGRECFVRRDKPDPEDIAKASEGLALAQKAVISGDYDLLILDEINVALDYGLLSLEPVLEILDGKPPAMDIVLTGRGAPQAIIDRADLVSEVKEIKHHYKQGVSAQAGIEF